MANTDINGPKYLQSNDQLLSGLKSFKWPQIVPTPDEKLIGFSSKSLYKIGENNRTIGTKIDQNPFNVF